MADKPIKIVYGTNIENQTNNITIEGNTFHGGNFYLLEEIEKAVKQSDSNTETSANSVNDERKQLIWSQIMSLIPHGPWCGLANEENITTMMANCLGFGVELNGNDQHLSEILWGMLTQKRGDRVKIVWANILGFFMDHQMLEARLSAPKIMERFFQSTEGAANINKGRIQNINSNDLREIQPLLEKFMPKEQ